MIKNYKQFIGEETWFPYTKDVALANIMIIVNILEGIKRQSKLSHWNVTGSNFVPLHDLFGSLYDFTDESIDKLVERFRALGGNQAPFDLSPKDVPLVSVDQMENLNKVVSMLETNIEAFSNNLDNVTGNMIQDILAEIDKFHWKLDSMRA